MNKGGLIWVVHCTVFFNKSSTTWIRLLWNSYSVLEWTGILKNAYNSRFTTLATDLICSRTGDSNYLDSRFIVEKPSLIRTYLNYLELDYYIS